MTPWDLFVDGSSSSQMGSEERVVIQDPTGEKIEHAVHLEIPTTSNVAEYEALLIGAKIF